MLKTFRKFLPTVWHDNVNLILKRNAGHSKWQNIRHIKGAKDAERSALFTKLGRMMKVAIQEGGSADPKTNPKLAQVVDQAKRSNMPVANIQSVIKSTQNDKSGNKPFTIEIKGPGSCFILCEVFTNNLQLVKQTIATILKKHSSKYSDGGGIHSFEEKGIIIADPLPEVSSKTEDEILELATEHAIESGAEEVKLIQDNLLEFICGATNLNAVVKQLEQVNYKISSASVEFTPLKLQILSENDINTCAKLYEKLENLPEVVRLSDNIA